MSDVIVLGANYSTALGVVRALGQAGYGVKLLSINKNCSEIAGKSKYVQQSLLVKRTIKDLLRGLDILRAKKERIIVLPTDDASCRLLAMNDTLLASHYDIPNISEQPGGLLCFMDKMKQKKLAEQCGIPVAKGDSYETDLKGIERALNEAEFPCFMKPLGDEKASKDLMYCCKDQKELGNAMKRAQRENCSRVLVEQYLPVEREYCLCGAAKCGSAVIPAVIDKIKIGNGAYKGITAEAIVRPSDFLGDLIEKLEIFAGRSGLTGLFDIELLESNGVIYFCEMNLRNSAAAYGITAAGANLPAALVEALINDTPINHVKIREEVHFVSEKVAIDDYAAGFLSWDEYQMRINNKYTHFIYDKEDNGPYKAFNRLVTRKRILRAVKRFI